MKSDAELVYEIIVIIFIPLRVQKYFRRSRPIELREPFFKRKHHIS